MVAPLLGRKGLSVEGDDMRGGLAVALARMLGQPAAGEEESHGNHKARSAAHEDFDDHIHRHDGKGEEGLPFLLARSGGARVQGRRGS